MEIRPTLLNLKPIDLNDLGKSDNVPTDTNPHCPPPDIAQLQIDVINVLEDRVPITSFDPEYQKRIKSYYRFSGTQYVSSNVVIAKRTSDTMDLV